MYKSFIIENCPATRVDRWLKREFPTVTQGQIEKWLRSKDILVNDKKVESSFRVNEFDTIQIKSVIADIMTKQDKSPLNLQVVLPTKAEADVLASFIIWEDDELLVLNKPSGLATQGGTDTHQHIDRLLKAYQQFYCPKVQPRLVHRLDRDTSGVLVVAKTLKAANNLAEQFKEHVMDKVYWAVCHGRASPLHGLIDAPIAKIERPGRGGETMAVDTKLGKKAQTNYRVVKSFSDFSWMELKPLTGRTHQLRVHMAWFGNPIRGDGKYGLRIDGKHDNETLHLHARSIKLKSIDGETLTFTAPPPVHIVETLSRNGINWEHYS